MQIQDTLRDLTFDPADPKTNRSRVTGVGTDFTRSGKPQCKLEGWYCSATGLLCICKVANDKHKQTPKNTITASPGMPIDFSFARNAKAKVKKASNPGSGSESGSYSNANAITQRINRIYPKRVNNFVKAQLRIQIADPKEVPDLSTAEILKQMREKFPNELPVEEFPDELLKQKLYRMKHTLKTQKLILAKANATSFKGSKPAKPDNRNSSASSNFPQKRRPSQQRRPHISDRSRSEAKNIDEDRSPHKRRRDYGTPLRESPHVANL